MKLVKIMGRKVGQAYHEIEFVQMSQMSPEYLLGLVMKVVEGISPVHIYLVTDGENWVKDTGYDLDGAPTVFWCQQNDDVLDFGAYTRTDAEDLLKAATDRDKANSSPDLRIEEFDVFTLPRLHYEMFRLQNAQFLVQYEPQTQNAP